MLCPICQNSFTPSKKNVGQRFCSKACGSKNVSLTRRGPNSFISEDVSCAQCNTSFRTSKDRKKFCSTSCRTTHQNLNRTYKKTSSNYRRACTFAFNPELYPDKFDTNLIKQVGWFHRKTNPNGLVKDHMLSVAEGFLNGISVEVINHPANCQLLTATENGRKSSKSSITLDELMRRIEAW